MAFIIQKITLVSQALVVYIAQYRSFDTSPLVLFTQFEVCHFYLTIQQCQFAMVGFHGLEIFETSCHGHCATSLWISLVVILPFVLQLGLNPISTWKLAKMHALTIKQARRDDLLKLLGMVFGFSHETLGCGQIPRRQNKIKNIPIGPQPKSTLQIESRYAIVF